MRGLFGEGLRLAAHSFQDSTSVAENKQLFPSYADKLYDFRYRHVLINLEEFCHGY